MRARIDAQGVGVRFLFDRQSRVVTPAFARLRRRGEEAWGIRSVSFSAGPGEGIALIGLSGSGKTTLLRTIARVFEPDVGRIDVRGRVASLLSIDAGLLSTLTGRENALLLGVLNGLSRRQSRAALGRIHERSALAGEFDHPVSSFSHGMRARLAFAVAEEAVPDILLLDEVHEALDYEFRAAVEERARRLRADGGIVVAAGHDHTMLDRLCDRGLLLEHGHVVEDGPVAEVRQAYEG